MENVTPETIQLDLVQHLANLVNLSPNSHDNFEAFSEKFRRLLLLFASETPDNVSCTEHIEIGVVNNNYMDRQEVCLKVKGKDISVSSLVWHAESLPIPDEVGESHPDLTQEEWDACLRVTTLVMMMLHGDNKLASTSKLRECKQSTS